MALPVRRLVVPVLMLLVAVTLAVRARFGLDLGDGTHAVELAMRLARGDLPFRDEMNLQVLGAWPAVPFVWVWLHAVGLEGIVLASRVYFVVLAVAVAGLAWVAVRGFLGRWVAGLAALTAVVPMAYNLQLVGYNTTPALLFLVGASSAAGAIARGSLGWGVLGGAAAVLGAVSHPVTTPAAVALLVVSLVLARRRVRAGLLAAAAAATSVVVGLAVLVWGIDHVRETLAFTTGYQRDGVDRLGRLDTWLSYLGGELGRPAVLVALALGVAAAGALWRGSRLGGPVLLAAVAITTAHGLTRGASTATYTIGSWLSPVMALVLSLVLLPSALVAAACLRGMPARLLVIGVTPGLVGAPVVAAFTASSPRWGAVGACLAPAVLAVSACALTGLVRLGGPGGAQQRGEPAGTARTLVAAGVGLLVLGSLVAAHTATSFRDAPLGRLDAAAPSGAYAGLLTSQRRADEVAGAQAALRSCARPGSTVLAIGYPAAYLMGDVEFASPVTWLGDFGASTSHIVRWLDARDVVPDCVVHPSRWWAPERPGGSVVDPLRDWVGDRYHETTSTSQLVVLGRNPG